MAHCLKVDGEPPREDDQLWQLYRQLRGNYKTICEILVARGLLAEMPRDLLDKPIKV